MHFLQQAGVSLNYRIAAAHRSKITEYCSRPDGYWLGSSSIFLFVLSVLAIDSTMGESTRGLFLVSQQMLKTQRAALEISWDQRRGGQRDFPSETGGVAEVIKRMAAHAVVLGWI